jgi:hypothetical protein
MIGSTLVAAPRETALLDALAASADLLRAAEREEKVACGAWIAPAERVIVLGRMQHAGRVLTSLDLGDWSVARRATTGTAAAVDGALVVSVALPAIDTVFRDATMRTVVNRNVRLLLAGLRSASVAAAYFGREWIAWQRRPLAVLGLEMTPSGAVLLEALFTLRGSLVLPRELTTDAERAVDRYPGKMTASLGEAVGERAPLDAARAIVDGIAERVGGDTLELKSIAEAPPSETAEVGRVTSLESPLPTGALSVAPRQVPIGWLDVARSPGGMWVGGDVLAPSFALGLGAPPPDGAPMEGASWDDVQRARDAAR